MKTLNGYEVVDGKARERLDTLVIPTKTSQLENDSQFTNKQYVDTAIETAKPDLTGYYTQAQTDAAIQTAIGNIDIPTVPTNVSAFTNDAQYTNKTYVDNAVASVDVSAQLTEYAKKTELPTKVSQLENDAGYLTEHQSLAGYATETYVDNKVAEIDLTGYATKQEVSAVENKIPSLDGYATKQELTAVENKIPSLTGYATEAYVDGKIAEIPATDLSNYYNKTETDSAISTAIAGITIPTKTSELTNDSNFVTETALETKGYLTEVPAEYVTETELNNKGYLTEHQSLADYATKTYVDGKIAEIPATEGSKVYHFDFSSFTPNSPQAATAEMIEFAESTLAGKHSCAYVRLDSSSLAFSPTKVAVDGSSVFLYNCYSGRASWSAETTASIAFYKFNDSWMANVTDKVNHRLATTTYVNDAIAAIPGTDLSNYYTKTEIDNKGYLTAIPDTYALKTDIPDVSSFTTMAAVEAKGYQTASDVTTLINNALGVIENGTY